MNRNRITRAQRREARGSERSSARGRRTPGRGSASSRGYQRLRGSSVTTSARLRPARSFRGRDRRRRRSPALRVHRRESTRPVPLRQGPPRRPRRSPPATTAARRALRPGAHPRRTRPRRVLPRRQAAEPEGGRRAYVPAVAGRGSAATPRAGAPDSSADRPRGRRRRSSVRRAAAASDVWFGEKRSTSTGIGRMPTACSGTPAAADTAARLAGEVDRDARRRGACGARSDAGRGRSGAGRAVAAGRAPGSGRSIRRRATCRSSSDRSCRCGRRHMRSLRSS